MKILGDGYCSCRFAFDSETGNDHASLPGSRSLLVPPRLRDAVPKRQAEFLAGRYCAIVAMSRLGIHAEDVGVGPGGEPLWPPECVGSITHIEGIAAAWVERRRGNHSLGIDMEHLVAAEEVERLAPLILLPSEQRLVQASTQPAYWLSIIFSAKEAIYKAVYSRVRRFIDFHEAETEKLDANILRFKLSQRLPLSPSTASSILVHYRVEAGVVTTAVKVTGE